MRSIFTVMLMIWASVALGDDGEWTPMDGAQITRALTGQSLTYANATQDFHASGRTLYNAGQDSWGYWTVRGDQYCSMWPPSDLWSCYAMARQGRTLRFIGAAGDVTDGILDD